MTDEQDDLSLVSIDAETPLGEIVAIARVDIASRKQLQQNGLPLEGKDVQALCSWGQLLNAVAKDHAKLFEDRVKKLGLGEIEGALTNHAVVHAAKAVAEKKARKK